MKSATDVFFPFVTNFPPSWKIAVSISFRFTKTRPHRYRRIFQEQPHSFGRRDQVPKEQLVQSGTKTARISRMRKAKDNVDDDDDDGEDKMMMKK